MRVEAVIFGGGVAGLWLLDRLVRQGTSAILLEAGGLGSGQTIASQGIIHGGLKYALQGLMNRSAQSVSEMPQLWRSALLGQRSPNLTHTALRSECCFLWRTDAWSSRLAMMGAKIGLQVRPETADVDELPQPLSGTPDKVARLGEQVICPQSFLADLQQQYQAHILKIDAQGGLEFELDSPGEVRQIVLKDPSGTGRILRLEPRHVILTAGAGNSELRHQVGLSGDIMQRRPLHMAMVRGDLPELNGHCVDGSQTRVTITTAYDDQHRTVWQIGGQLAEMGVALDEDRLISHALSELRAVLPTTDFSKAEWSTYRVDRAERSTLNGKRPDGVQIYCAGNVTTGWPTKLALAPVMADEIAARIGLSHETQAFDLGAVQQWPRPQVAPYPWQEAQRIWLPTVDVITPVTSTRRAA